MDKDAGEWCNGVGFASVTWECVMVDYEDGTFHEGFGRNGLDSEDRLALQELSQKLIAKGIRHILIADNIETIVYKAAIDPDFLIKGFGVLQGYAVLWKLERFTPCVVRGEVFKIHRRNG